MGEGVGIPSLSGGREGLWGVGGQILSAERAVNRLS